MAEAIQVNWQHANYNGQFHNRSFSFIKIKPHFNGLLFFRARSEYASKNIIFFFIQRCQQLLQISFFHLKLGSEHSSVLQYVIMCVFPRSQSKWPPCYVKLPSSFLCSFKILRSTVSERGRAAVLFVGNLLTSNLLHIIRQKSIQLPSNNIYDQMCVLMNIFESLGWSPNCWESGGPCSSPLLCTVNNEMDT